MLFTTTKWLVLADDRREGIMTGRVFAATPRSASQTSPYAAAQLTRSTSTYCNLKNVTETKIAANTQIRSMSSIVLSA
jgi:hypothetical protein